MTTDNTFSFFDDSTESESDFVGDLEDSIELLEESHDKLVAFKDRYGIEDVALDNYIKKHETAIETLEALLNTDLPDCLISVSD